MRSAVDPMPMAMSSSLMEEKASKKRKCKKEQPMPLSRMSCSSSKMPESNDLMNTAAPQSIFESEDDDQEMSFPEQERS
jgi:hypothetical protein